MERTVSTADLQTMVQDSTSCDTDDDCADSCPDGSLDCTCFIGFDGTGFCVPACETDDDCSSGMECVVEDGICGPGGGGMDEDVDEGGDGAPPPTRVTLTLAPQTATVMSTLAAERSPHRVNLMRTVSAACPELHRASALTGSVAIVSARRPVTQTPTAPLTSSVRPNSGSADQRAAV